MFWDIFPTHLCRFAVRTTNSLHAKIFLEAWDQPVAAALRLPPHHLSVLTLRLWPTPPRESTYWLGPHTTWWLVYPSPSLLASTRAGWCRNINLLTIAYAFRPRLRIRLTLGGLTWPRKPWVYGERVSHPFYRYSCLHKLFQKLQPSFRSTFSAAGILPYHSKESAASVPCLSPVTFSAQAR